jgi:2-polyprenyl-3-methyl-5-hydroxy-6-metoxy-1,4-benzoquinol methylase
MTVDSASLDLVDAATYPYFSRLIQQILQQWPEHERYLRINVGEREPALLAFSEQLSELIWKIGSKTPDGMSSLVTDYRFLCQDIVMAEELHFRRHGKYRLNTFEEALTTIYSNKPFMTRYMNGLLVSDVIWINHCRCMMHFAQQFLPSLKQGANLLEIGPGHGLLLYLADGVSRVGTTTAWDVSEASLELGAHTLKTLGAKRVVKFEQRNIFDDQIVAAENESIFDGVVLSEVLEHLEEPLRALNVLFHLCKPGGYVWVNVPANSPAPDHLFLVNELSEAVSLVKQAGFEVTDAVAYPTSGVTIERATKQKLTMNCVVVGRKPA